MKETMKHALAHCIADSYEWSCEWPSIAKAKEIAFDELEMRITPEDAVAALQLGRDEWRERQKGARCND